MNPSAEKRKMARMQVDLPVSIFLEKPKGQSQASVLDLSIHGMSFGSNRTLTQGTQFQVLFPDQGKLFDKRKIQAEVVRCETLAGCSDKKFKIGVKFLFKYRGSDSDLNETSRSLQSLKPRTPGLALGKWRNGDPVPQPARLHGSGQETWLIQKGEINAEYCQVIRLSADKKEQRTYTVVKLKDSRPASIASTVQSTGEFIQEVSKQAFLAEPFSGGPLAKPIPEKLQ